MIPHGTWLLSGGKGNFNQNSLMLLNLIFIFILLLLSGDIELNPGPLTCKQTILLPHLQHALYAGRTPTTILRTNYVRLTDAITSNLDRVTNGLYAKELIPMDIVNFIQTAIGISDLRKSSQLVSVLQKMLRSSSDPNKYLIDTCHVLINQQCRTLTDIGTSILLELGKFAHQLIKGIF